MGSDMKQEATVTISQDDFALIQEALQEKHKRHKGFANTSKNSGYGFGRASTMIKIDKHNEKAEACLELETRLAYSFI